MPPFDSILFLTLLAYQKTAAEQPSKQDLRQLFIHAMCPMIGFGIMDNFIMIQAGDAIDNHFGAALGIATLTAAAFGQVFSDVSGVLFGGVGERLDERAVGQMP